MDYQPAMQTTVPTRGCRGSQIPGFEGEAVLGAERNRLSQSSCTVAHCEQPPGESRVPSNRGGSPPPARGFEALPYRDFGD